MNKSSFDWCSWMAWAIPCLSICKKEGRKVRLLVEPGALRGHLAQRIPHAFENGVEIIEADLQDRQQLKTAINGIGTVFHAAAVQHPKSVSQIYAINSEATYTLARLAGEAGVEKFVFVSSGLVQGPNLSSQPTDEEHLGGRVCTHYSMSKMKAESLLQEVREDYDTSIVIIRPGVFYGLNASKNMERLMSMLQNSWVPLFGKEGFCRTYVNVQKVAEAILLAEARGVSGQAYIIGDTEPLSTLQFYQAIANGLNCTPRTIAMPLMLSRTAEKLAVVLGYALGWHWPTANLMGEFGRNSYFTSVKAQEIGFIPLESSRPWFS